MERCCCYQCDKRKANCHAWCELYKAWKAKDQVRVQGMENEKLKDAIALQRFLVIKNKWLLRKQKGRYHL